MSPRTFYANFHWKDGSCYASEVAQYLLLLLRIYTSEKLLKTVENAVSCTFTAIDFGRSCFYSFLFQPNKQCIVTFCFNQWNFALTSTKITCNENGPQYVCTSSKGQLISKANCQAVDSTKKMNKRICSFWLEEFLRSKVKSCSFIFLENLRSAILLTILDYLKYNNWMCFPSAFVSSELDLVAVKAVLVLLYLT
mgnify:CR=1 FL=1